MKDMFVNDITEGDTVDTYFAVSSKGPTRQYKNKAGLWFSAEVSDRTGRLNVMYWGNDDAATRQVFESLEAGDVVLVRGVAGKYNGRLQVSVNPGTGHIKKTRQYERGDLVPSAELDVEPLKAALQGRVSAIRNPQIRGLLESFFGDESFMDRYAAWPAAKSYHHGYAGGLLQHSLNMVRLAMSVSENYPAKLDEDLLVAGCLLHDIGKLRQYEMDLTITYTADGDYLGHIAIGAMMVQGRISSMREAGEPFDEDTERHILHIILSHHGELEHGSPVKPATPEAMVVHKVDACDAQAKHMLEAKDDGARF